MIKALIFDFDGLILETEIPDYQAWQEVYRERGVELPMSVWSGVVGSSLATAGFDPLTYLERLIGRPVDRADIMERRERRYLEFVAEQPIMPGVEAVLDEAKQLGLALAIASSSPYSWVGGNLDRLGLLGRFDVIKTADDVERTKPDPALYLAALKALAVGPHEAIVFEDSPNGVTAAKRVGIFTVAVPTEMTAALDLSHADMRVRSLAGLHLEHLISNHRLYR